MAEISQSNSDRSIAELPLDAAERKELHDLANKAHWAHGVLIDSALWNLEQAEAERDRLRAENTWLRNQMGDVRGMQSDGATPEEMDEALGRALAGQRARYAFDVLRSRASSDEEGHGDA